MLLPKPAADRELAGEDAQLDAGGQRVHERLAVGPSRDSQLLQILGAARHAASARPAPTRRVPARSALSVAWPRVVSIVVTRYTIADCAVGRR
jgi:hypothetical protein